MSRHIYVLLMMWAFSMIPFSECHSQSMRRFLQKADSLLSYRYTHSNIDTSYIMRPATKWTLKGRLNVSGADVGAEGVSDGVHFRSKLEADFKTTVSLSVNYLGVALGLALNPGKLSGSYQDYEFNMNSYSNRFGFDIIYQNARNFKGHYESDMSEPIDMHTDWLRLQSLNVNAYYAFNYRRFSSPAAFSQSFIQRRSAGSFLLALSVQGQRALADEDLDLGGKTMKLKSLNFGIGAGYGYNFVPSARWLLHVSVLPTLVVASHASLRYDGECVPMPYHFPQVVTTGRFAVVYQFSKRYFAGLTSVLTYSNIGDDDRLSVENLKWRNRAFFGIRF